MITRTRKLAICSLAREKLLEHNAMCLPVKPKAFAENNLGIVVQSFDPPHPSISGFLVRVGNSFGIGYSKAIRSEGFQNFTVAHELGHYFIDDHAMAVLSDGRHFSHSGYISKDRYEEEADAFATEFLMPWKLVESVLKRSGGGFEAIKNLADQCESSLLASAIRYAEVTEEQVAVVVSHQGIVEFMTASGSFRDIPGISWLHRGDAIPDRVCSSRFATSHDWLDAGLASEGGCNLRDWFPTAPGVDIGEDVVGLGSYRRLLTVLVADCEAEADDDNESEKDDYIERWQEGRFRKK